MANKQKDVKYFPIFNQYTTLNGLVKINERLLDELKNDWGYWPSGLSIHFKYYINERFYTGYYWALHKYVIKDEGEFFKWPKKILKKAQERNQE